MEVLSESSPSKLGRVDPKKVAKIARIISSRAEFLSLWIKASPSTSAPHNCVKGQ